MEYNYNFTKEEKRILYSELKNIINSKEYKLLRKEYYKLINQVTKNIFYLNLEQPFQIAYLLNNNINDFFSNSINNCELDLDVLYKLWGSRVCTNNFSNRHIVSFINDVLIKSGYMSCKLLVCKKDINSSTLHSLNNNFKMPNDILLCLLINSKKFMFDIEKKEILKFNKVLSNKNYNCYMPITNREKTLYFINIDDINNLEINDEHLFVLNEYIYCKEFIKKDYASDLYLTDYMNSLDNSDINLLDIDENNISIIASLNDEITKKQNEIYKKVKKIN